jgi:hypothetical protein
MHLRSAAPSHTIAASLNFPSLDAEPKYKNEDDGHHKTAEKMKFPAMALRPLAAFAHHAFATIWVILFIVFHKTSKTTTFYSSI